ncbi:MAG: hypothetical protein EBZ36_00255 [Acidobacteria bacterium]|nr:hypothetical protein [Acidobacteriota bacterium]
MLLLRVTYRLRAHHVTEYERVFAAETLPLIKEHGLNFRGIWRSLVGDAQEYLELFEFESLADFELRWRALAADPRLQRIFAVTGPMVEDEKFAVFDPVLPGFKE